MVRLRISSQLLALALVLVLALAAAQTLAQGTDAPAAAAGPPTLTRFSATPGSQPAAPWRVVGLPRSKTPLTQFDVLELDGARVLRVQATLSYGQLVHELPRIEPSAATMLRWRWRLETPLLRADLRSRPGDDAPVKVCAMFDMPLEGVGLVERGLLRATRSLSGEPLPSATLCYVWDHSLPVGTLLPNAFTSRIRLIVLNSGEQQLGQWISHQRNLAADFARAFGHEYSGTPPLIAVSVMADDDNTRDQSLAYVGDVSLAP